MVRIIGTSLPTMHSVWRHHVHSVAAVLVFIQWYRSYICYIILSVLYFIQWYRSYISASETPRIYAMFFCKFTPGVEKMLPLIRKNAILTNIWLKKCRRSDGVNDNTSKISSFYFRYRLKYGFFNLVTTFMWNTNKPSLNTNFTQIWLIRINKDVYDQC